MFIFIDFNMFFKKCNNSCTEKTGPSVILSPRENEVFPVDLGEFLCDCADAYTYTYLAVNKLIRKCVFKTLLFLGSTVVIDCKAVVYSDFDEVFWLSGNSFVETDDDLPVFYNFTW